MWQREVTATHGLLEHPVNQLKSDIKNQHLRSTLLSQGWPEPVGGWPSRSVWLLPKRHPTASDNVRAASSGEAGGRRGAHHGSKPLTLRGAGNPIKTLFVAVTGTPSMFGGGWSLVVSSDHNSFMHGDSLNHLGRTLIQQHVFFFGV